MNTKQIIGSLPLIPFGFSDKKGDPDYWDEAYKDFWVETGLDTDSTDLAIIVTWFDKRRETKQ
jgi:hypothetical protein